MIYIGSLLNRIFISTQLFLKLFIYSKVSSFFESHFNDLCSMEFLVPNDSDGGKWRKIHTDVEMSGGVHAVLI